MDDLVGSAIEKYRVVKRIGEGGMGVIYEASHQDLPRPVAIKVLHVELSEDREIAVRFLNEARAVNIIRHPALVDIFGFGELPSGAPYIVMELLEGVSLGQRLAREAEAARPGALAEPEALWIAWQVADALAAAHEQRIIHRDLKPDNIMLVPLPGAQPGARPQVKVFDFGLAKLRQEHLAEGATLLETAPGVLMGTPTYMAPEQCVEEGLTDKVDVYALGTILYLCLAGRPPFVSTRTGQARILQLLMMKSTTEAPSIAGLVPGISPRLARLLTAMLARVPARRPTMAQVAKQLAALVAEEDADESVEITLTDDGPPAEDGAPGATAPLVPAQDRTPARRKRLLPLLATVLALGTALAGFLLLR